MIKDSTLDKLTRYFLDISPEVISRKIRLSKILREAKGILTKDLNRGVKWDEKYLLRKYQNSLINVSLRMGDMFKQTYYPDDRKISLTYNPYYISTLITIRDIPRSCPMINISRGDPKLSKGALDKLIPLNDEILEILQRIQEISECFRRWVTPETSLVWLRENMPGVYQKLKEYED